MRQTAARAAKTAQTQPQQGKSKGRTPGKSQKADLTQLLFPFFFSNIPQFSLLLSRFFLIYFSTLFPNTVTTLFSFPRFYSSVFTRWFPIRETTLFALVFFGKKERTGKARRGMGLGG
ncbi:MULTISPECIES: hypothetical protein [unclassified Paenibacillus]|uniref:hypothetical protein n=1 Tax=unclassified Paenibacillus TaxID=185978 RepID=UPI002404C112|nr:MULTISPECIES: hypothetical protein [unclassified Paenibacillus]MDF9844338.1 hypothetical protein [Paenibacillus sp. PastF-2]MDF9850873.1 hypothetical protein [Paenibacillus sp. PastM-2]MDF9857513.1 hypothetical protein [Paenibacillus sp. PastF-1]